MAKRQTLLGSETVNFAKLSALLMDDNSYSLDVLAIVCLAFGLGDVTKVSSVEGARTALQRQRFDILLADTDMGHEDGFQVVEWLRRKAPEDNRWIPCIMLSGHTRRSAVFDSRDCGSHFVVAKPVTPTILLQRLVWLGRDDRAFVESETYCGPDRRFQRLGPPIGTKGRRSDDAPPKVSPTTDPDIHQHPIIERESSTEVMI